MGVWLWQKLKKQIKIENTEMKSATKHEEVRIGRLKKDTKTKERFQKK
jgi:hypothetical protein